MGGFHTPGFLGAGQLNSLDNKIVVGVPGVDSNNVSVPLIAARIAGYHTQSGRWIPVCTFDPANPDVPGTACGLWTRIIDFPESVRVQVVDGATGNTALFLSGPTTPADPGFAVRLVPSGPQLLTAAQAIVFATDHPPVMAELVVGGNVLSNANSVPVQGAIPPCTPRGTPTAASSGVILDAPGALLRIRMSYTGSGMGHFLQLFDATSLDTLATSLLMPGYSYPLGVTLPRSQEVFTYGLKFTTGIRWAISSTEHTYTSSAETAIVTAQWKPGVF